MNSEDLLKKVLKNALELESELKDLLIECFVEIFGEKSKEVYDLKEDLSLGMECNGCLQSLSMYKRKSDMRNDDPE